MRSRIAVVVCGLFVFYIATLSVAARAAQSASREVQSSSRTIWSGVYTAAQAKRGELAAKAKCTNCHEVDLTGGQDGPGLAGAEVLDAWSSMTLQDLFERVNTTMPADAPRSLSPQETADILAYVLSLNKAPAGETELSADMAALGGIRITRQPQ